MGKELTLIGDVNLPVPEHIADLYRDTPSNLVVEGERLPSLGIRGKVFSISTAGETVQLMKTDADGEEVPVSTLPVVIVDYNQRKGRAWREVDAFDADNPSGPDCYSLDSITPDPASPKIQASACSKCKWSAKNSRVNELGKGIVACKQHRILVVVPSRRLDIGPLKLKIPQTSDYDGRSKDLEARNRFAFQNMLHFVKARNVPHTQTIEVKLQFDPNVDYPKLTFSPTTYLDPTTLETVREMAASDLVKEMLASPGDEGPVAGGEDDESTGDVEHQAAVAAAEAAAKRQAEVARQTAAAKLEADAEAKRKAEAEKKAKAEAKAKKAADDAAAKAAADAAKAADTKPSMEGLGDDDDDEENGGDLTVAAPKPTKPSGGGAAAKPSTKPVEPKEAAQPAALAGLLSKWTDDD